LIKSAEYLSLLVVDDVVVVVMAPLNTTQRASTAMQSQQHISVSALFYVISNLTDFKFKKLIRN